MDSIGIPEVIIVVVALAFWAVPILASVWAVITLHRLRIGQDALRQRLESIERALQRPAST